MPNKKAFIVYATEDYELTKNFVEYFKMYNPGLDILYDKNPYSNNIDDQLIGYAHTCDLAIILASQRLMHPDHYSNQNEIPVLIERRKKKEASIVGVKLRDAKILDWNKDGEIPFFQMRYADLRNSRGNGKYSALDDNQFAVYELIDKSDWGTYHKELSEWVDEILKKK